MKKAPIIVLLFLNLFSYDGFAQTYPIRVYSIEDGLSESVVNAMLQDRDGYIWFATGYGLNKFDGTSFRSFFEDNGLNSSKVLSLYQSRDGTIWIGTDRGINYMSGDSIYTNTVFQSLNNSSVISIFEDAQGEMWFGTDGDGLWYSNNGTDLGTYTTSNGLRSNEIRAIAQSENADLWFATRNGLTRLSNGNLRTYTILNGLPEDRTRDVLVDDSGYIWIATRNGISRFNGQTFMNFGAVEGIADLKVQTISQSEDGTIWAGTESGISHLRDGKFRNYGIPEGMSNEIVYSSMVDREGNIWFGTFGGGANVFFGEYIESFDTNTGLPNDVVTSMSEDDRGNLWVATYGGGLAKRNSEPDAVSNFDYMNSRDGLLDERVYHISKDSKGRMWIGMRDGLAFYKNGVIRNFTEDEFPYRKVRHVMEDSKGDIWISAYDEGLIKMNESGLTHFDESSGLPNNPIIATVEDDEGVIWIATYGGVVRFRNGEFENFTIQEGLPNNSVMSIIKDQSGTIWVSTDQGVAWFDGVRFVDITEEDGLPDKKCYFISQDSNGMFWIGTNAGIARLDVQKFYSDDMANSEDAIQTLTKEQGLVADEMNLGAVFEDDDGHMWFGSVEGVSHFDPGIYKGNHEPPIVHILSFNASGQEYKLNGVELPHSKNFIEISFAGINFTAPNKVLFEYQMEGIDPGWQRTSLRTVRYQSLPPGEYTFRIHARNSSGIWSPKMSEIRFTITPPFWMTCWFIILNALALSGVIYLFYRNYKISKMVDIERMRVRIASDLHDDVGASLTEIALQSDFLQASSLDDEFKSSLTQIGMQCRRIVTSLDDIVWSIDARNDTLGDLTDRMQDYALNVLDRKNIEVSYDFDDLKMEDKLPVPIKENLYLIFKEAVNNISKYSNGDKVRVEMKTNNDDYHFMVHDNGTTGKGLKKTGHGLRNMEMRAHRIGGIFDFNDEDGFTITLDGKLNMN